ncbi:MAG TPA: HEAT repeat domain-containing protein [Anaerolineae bacterium]|nr:HEAT repeat domain-containing protein [Anaerolineae bacterium]
MDRLQDTLKIRPGEGRLAALLIGLMFFVSAGGAIGGNAIDALFFSRFGTQYLPTMYMALGVVAFVTLLSTSALLGRVTRERLYVRLPVVLALVLIGERALLTLDFNWFYPVLWLGMNVMGALQALFTWGLAGATADARQAKRLFPLFGAGGILGAAIGGFVTAPLSRALHTENLLLIWAGALVVAFVLGRALTGRVPGRPRVHRAGIRKQASPVDQIRQGYRFVRESRLMRLLVVSATLSPIMMYSLVLPFSRAAAAEFPGEDALAGFLGTFQGVTTAAAFLTSLFVANRLFARFGIMAARMGLPVIGVIGFSVLAVYPVFPAIAAFRFFDSTWTQGVSSAAYQAVFNVVPPQRREQTRAFISAVPDQIGTIVAGLILAVGQQALQPQHLYLVGLGAALIITFVLLQQRRAYRGALVDALHAGQPQVFFDEEEPFGGFRRDASAVSVAAAGLLHPETAVRRVSVEILGHLPLPGASDALIDALSDQDAEVRAAALHALACAKATPALLDIAACLNDPEPEVRTEAVDALSQLAGYRRGLVTWIHPLLADPYPAVRARVAATLLRGDADPEARGVLAAMAEAGDAESRIQAMSALGEWGDPQSLEWIAAGLHDPLPGVRRAAASAFAPMGIRLTAENAESAEKSIQRPRAMAAEAAHARASSISAGSMAGRFYEPLIRALGDDDSSVREAAAAAIGRIGPSMLDPAVSALSDPALESGALAALEHLPIHRAADTIREYARESASRAAHCHSLLLSIAPNGDDPPSTPTPLRSAQDATDHPTTRLLDHSTTPALRLLADSLSDAARRRAINALRAVGLLADRHAMATAIDNLKSRDPNQRAYAMETLESIGEQHVVRPLLSLWEGGEATSARSDGWLVQLLQDSDAWLRACAALVAGGSADPQARDLLERLAQSDADALVRETASAVKGDSPVHTLQTLSVMERVLFLRRVPLFGDLSPADLKHVAAIADERFFHDGDVIARQGDLGDEMFIIVSGEVRVLEAADGGLEAPGAEVARRKLGEFVGEMALISQGPRVASLVAEGHVRVLCLDQKQFEGMLRERPEISLAVMRVLIARLKESETRVRGDQ